MINPQITENIEYNSKISQKSSSIFVMGYALNLCKFHLYKVPYNHNIVEEGMEMTQNRIRIVDVADTLGQYRIILSADTASEVRQMPSQKRRQYFVYYRAFWQRRCRAAAAGAVLKPQGGNCAVLP